MARPVTITDQEVFAGIERLLAGGKAPHVRALAEELGGRGSTARLSVLIERYWEEYGPSAVGKKPAQKVPGPLMSTIEALWSQLTAEARKSEEGRAAAERGRIQGWEGMVKDREQKVSEAEARLEERTEDLKRYVEEQERRRQDAEVQAAKALQAAEAAEANRRAAMTAKEEADKARAAAVADAKQVAEALAGKEAELTEATARIADSEAKLMGARGELNEARQDQRQLRTQLAAALARCEKLDEALAATREAASKAEMLRAATGLQLADVKSELSVAVKEIDGNKTLIAELRQQKADLASERDKQAGELVRLGERIELMQKDLATVRARSQGLEQQLQDRDAQMVKLERERDAAMKAREAALARTKQDGKEGR